MRTRITLVATSVVAVALVLGAVGFWLTLRTSLFDGLRNAAEQDAAVIAERIEADGLGLVLGDPDERLVQVVDESGAVVFGQRGRAPHRRSPTTTTRRRCTSTTRRSSRRVESFSSDAGDGTVIVGRDTESAEETLATVAAPPLDLGAAPHRARRAHLVDRRRPGALARSSACDGRSTRVTASTLARRIDEPPVDDEIGRLARTLNGMLDRLEAAQATQRRFISDASHELKSPLAALRQYAEVARAHPERIGLDELGDAVLDEGGRLERLVQGMLVLANADEGALRLERSDVDLDDLLLDEARRVRDGGRLCGRHERHHRRAGAGRSRASCASSCATSSTTRPGTPPQASPSRSRRSRLRHPWCSP